MTPEQIQRAIDIVLARAGRPRDMINAVQAVTRGPCLVEVKVRTVDDGQWYREVLPFEPETQHVVVEEGSDPNG